MAKLSQLIPQYHTLSHEQRVQLVRDYRARRDADIQAFLLTKQPKSRSPRKANAQILSEDDKLLCKVLGLSPKQLLMLKTIEPKQVEEEAEEDEDEEDE